VIPALKLASKDAANMPVIRVKREGAQTGWAKQRSKSAPCRASLSSVGVRARGSPLQPSKVVLSSLTSQRMFGRSVAATVRNAPASERMTSISLPDMPECTFML
jgi:hypothetical protein